MRALDWQVAAIVDFVTQIRDALSQSRDANRRWSQVHATLALPITQRHAENRDGLAGTRHFQIRVTASFDCVFDHWLTGSHSNATSDSAVSSFGPGSVPW